MKIVVAGTIEKISTRQDNSIVLTFSTQEMDADDAGKVFNFRNKYCKILLTDDNINPLQEEAVIGTAIAETGKKKTPSQRLRAVLWRVWEQQNSQIEFEQYYATEMERIIEHYRAKLDQ